MHVIPAASVGGSDIIYTVAGNGSAGYSGDGGAATGAQLNFPLGIWVDSAGNLFIADYRNHSVRKVSPAGVITTVAGTGVAGFSGDGGPATSAQFHYTYGVTADSSGNLYVADSDNNRIRRISPAGIVTTVAGAGPGGYFGDGGPATSSYLYLPTGVARDAAGNMYIAEMYGRVRKVAPDGVITTVAGTGVAGYSGDGGPATSAQVRDLTGLCLDGSGNLYLADRSDHRIRKVSPAGIITTVAGNGVRGFSGDGGPATAAQLSGPSGVTVDSAGNIYIADAGNSRVRKVSPGGVMSTVAGNGSQTYGGDGGPATSAQIGVPFGVALSSSGDLYISDYYNNRIRVVRAGGTVPALSITTPSPLLQGTVGAAYSQPLSASGGSTPYTWSVASGSLPAGLTLNGGGTIFGTPTSAGSSSFTVQVRDSAGTAVTASFALTVAPAPLTIATNSPLPAASVGIPYSQTFSATGGSAPYTWTMTSAGLISGLTFSGTGILSGTPAVAGTYSFNIQVWDKASVTVNKPFTLVVAAGGAAAIITTVAGTGTGTYSGDGGPAINASLFNPSDVAMDSAGNLYIADTLNARIRKVSNGVITTVAGNGIAGTSGENVPATDSKILSPQNIAIDSAGALYFAEGELSNRIRRVFNGVITTVAGNGTRGYSGDNGPATSAALAVPTDVAVDSSGNLYIADLNNSRIRKVSNGVITTFAGNGVAGYSGDNGPATNAQLNRPAGVAIDSFGNLYIADTYGHRVRKVSNGVITTVAGTGFPGYSGDSGPATSARLTQWASHWFDQ
jgi:sugar lactone lactonase YvrE